MADTKGKGSERTNNLDRNSGNSAKVMMEKSIRANTDMSSFRRDARTIEEETAALIDRTDVSLERFR